MDQKAAKAQRLGAERITDQHAEHPYIVKQRSAGDEVIGPVRWLRGRRARTAKASRLAAAQTNQHDGEPEDHVYHHSMEMVQKGPASRRYV